MPFNLTATLTRQGRKMNACLNKQPPNGNNQEILSSTKCPFVTTGTEMDDGFIMYQAFNITAQADPLSELHIWVGFTYETNMYSVR